MLRKGSCYKSAARVLAVLETQVSYLFLLLHSCPARYFGPDGTKSQRGRVAFWKPV